MNPHPVSNRVNTPASMVTPIQPITDDLPPRTPAADRPVRVLTARFADASAAAEAVREFQRSERYTNADVRLVQAEPRAEQVGEDLELGAVEVIVRAVDAVHAEDVLKRHGGRVRETTAEETRND